MSQIFNLNIRKLSILLTPTFLRKERFLAWLYCLVYPLEFVYEAFLKRRTEDIYKLEHTAQVFSLEKVLNDAFDIAERRIRIGDVERKEPFYIFSEAENTPAFIYQEQENKEPIYLYSEGVSVKGGYDFMVYLPLEIWNAEKTEVSIGEYRFYAIEALLDFYKLGGKKYKIVLQ